MVKSTELTGDGVEARWYFAVPGPVQRQRNSKLDEHFAGSGSDRAGDIVREGGQNSGDAALNGAPVRVRITFGELDADRALVYAVGLKDHVKEVAKQKDMATVQALTDGEVCKFLAFEDFNTTGLTGDPHQERRYDEDAPNAFHTFFRAEGQTDKVDGHKQGSKGVGKVTFLAASRIRAILGYTCRNDDGRELLFGTAVLRTHRFQGKDYDGDAWYGLREDEKQAVQPIEDAGAIAQFREDFGLTRQLGKSGLSIVVPWLDTNEEDGVTPQRVIRAVLRDHVWPILSGKLVVEVVAEGGAATTIDAAHFLPVLDAHGDPALKAQVRPMAELAAWALAHPPTAPADRLGMHKETAPAWEDKGLLSAEHRDRLRKLLDAGEPVAIRVPIRIRPQAKGKADVVSHFDVFLRREIDGPAEAAAAAAGPTVQFVRNGLLVIGMAKRVPGWRAVVVAEEEGVSSFLRASENPSHTRWNAKPIKELFKYAPGTLKYVVESVKHLAVLLAGDPSEKDATVWRQELSLPAGEQAVPTPPGGKGGGGKKSVRPGKDDEVENPKPPPKKRPYSVQALDGAVVVRQSGRPFPRGLPARLELRLAYHVRGKNPLKHYAKADFDLTDEGAFPCEVEGCAVEERDPNRLLLRIDAEQFTFRTTGFDTRREVFCKPKLEGGETADERGDDGDDDDGGGPGGPGADGALHADLVGAAAGAGHAGTATVTMPAATTTAAAAAEGGAR